MNNRGAVAEAVVLAANRIKNEIGSLDDLEAMAVDLITDALDKIYGAARTQGGPGVAGKYRTAATIQLQAAVAALKAANDQR